jgi:amidase
LLDATAGTISGESQELPTPARPFLAEVTTAPADLRIAYSMKTLTGAAVHPDCATAAERSAKLCSDLGHTVEENEPKLNVAVLMDSFLTVWASASAAIIDGLAERIGRKPAADELEPLTWGLYGRARCFSASKYLSAVAAFESAAQTMSEFFKHYDVWLTPTLGLPPLPLGSFKESWFVEAIERTCRFAPFARIAERLGLAALSKASTLGFEFVPFTWVANIAGVPAMSMPLFWSSDNLPIGSHFVGRFGDEATLFRLAGQLEQAVPWAHRRPEVKA